MSKTQIQLGNVVRCKITGFKGTVTQRMEQFNGNIQFAVQPKGKDGAPMPDAHFLDHHMLEFVGVGVAASVTPVPVLSPIKIGNLVEDMLSGFTGTVMSRHTFLNGCEYFTVVPKVGTDKMLTESPSDSFIAASRLRLVGVGVEQTKPVPQVSPATGYRAGGPSSKVARPMVRRG